MPSKLRHLLTALALFAAPSALAQSIAVKAARALDVTAGSYIPDAVILIADGKITRIGSRLPIPADAQVIDLGDATVLPGLIDSHTHLMARMSGKDGDYIEKLATASVPKRALEGAANAKLVLRAGFTTVRDVENEGTGYADLDLRDAINEGLVEGPRMQASSRAIAMVGQYNPFGVAWDLTGFPTGAQMVSGVEEARRAAREQIGHGANLLKVYADWDYPTFSEAEIHAIVEEAHRAGHKVAAHATTPEGIANAINAGVDSIEHGFYATPETLKLMKAKNVFWVTTIGQWYQLSKSDPNPKARAWLSDHVEKIRANYALARQMGIRMAAGFDASTAPDQGHALQELEALAALGFTRAEVLRMATVNGAELMGWSDAVGALKPGLAADMIAVRGDPLKDIAVLEKLGFVMKGGQVIRDDYHMPNRALPPQN